MKWYENILQKLHRNRKVEFRINRVPIDRALPVVAVTFSNWTEYWIRITGIYTSHWNRRNALLMSQDEYNE